MKVGAQQKKIQKRTNEATLLYSMLCSCRDENKVSYKEKAVVKMIIKTLHSMISPLFSHADRCMYALLTLTDAPTPTARRQACQRDYYAEIRAVQRRAKLCLISVMCVRGERSCLYERERQK